MKRRIILGLVGTLGAGKSTAVDYLVTKGFDYFKLSDIIRRKYKLKNADRGRLQDLGDELRKKFGKEFLAKEAWRKIEKSGSNKIVVDGLRNVGEANFLRQKNNFYLISIDKERRARFKRLKIRRSDRDPVAWQEFLAVEKRDLAEDKEYGQQTKQVMAMADFSINNDTPIEFMLELEEILRKVVD